MKTFLIFVVLCFNVNAALAQSTQCPNGGFFDGANCQIGKAPNGTTAFIWGGNYYYTKLPGNICPYPGSYFDGANCFVQAIPSGVQPFIYANHWYYQANPTSNCQAAVTATGSQHTVKFDAKGGARDQWKQKAGTLYGGNFGHWNKAKNKNVSCNQINKWPHREWVCTATATPCK